MTNGKKVVYLGGPYTSDDKIVMNKRYTNYRKIAGLVVSKHDSFVFAPITHSHPIVTHKSFDPAFNNSDAWLPLDLVILGVCDELWIAELDGWEASKGTAQEIEFAKANGIPIKMITLRGRVYDYEA